EEPKTACQRKPTAPLALSSSVRRDPAHFARLRPLRRPSRPKQHRDFHQTERRLTSHRSGDIARARKKGGLNLLYRPRTNSTGTPPMNKKSPWIVLLAAVMSALVLGGCGTFRIYSEVRDKQGAAA